jgi:deazaflavin-dependent oxidoreductase (nitroreductase family)
MTESTNPWEDNLIAAMRANNGAVTQGPLAGHPLMIVTSTGAQTGQPRRAILTWSRDGDDYVVAGTAGGSPITPGWVHNMAVNPSVSIEMPPKEFEATARVIESGPERDRLWDQHVAALPWFQEYPDKVGDRVIPMIRLTPSAVR